MREEKIKIMQDLHKKQEDLDLHIKRSNNLMGRNLFGNTVIACDVELAEFINEEQSFKHWKKVKHKDVALFKRNLLEEASDVFHFLLSLANMQNHTLQYVTNTTYDKQRWITEQLVCRQYAKAKKFLWSYYVDKDAYLLNGVLRCLVIILNAYDYTFEDLIQEYYRKNEINHKRQVEGY
nr:MAG TPA: dUTPase [Caudoviricetes sp.]